MKQKDRVMLGMAVMLAATAGVYLAWCKRNARTAETPPKDAPQLHLDNPGEQSGFPAAPLDDRGLG